ncbi:hypothetical protein NDR87_28025 [Nocardia sp. CDC159]|uniref:Uncharacterized protein n=1 Tax=Nocardia pulmonis TaxID=2951408 RepID=A0A9X2J1U0_9NOCA|nr:MULTISPECIES: hypothetical protein [Nocardia]MCM6777341.1 hypothetical protein [Nocardia pulmonis]MCM6790226.1 hypothetical protein [Nocardia sp. CDC159]
MRLVGTLALGAAAATLAAFAYANATGPDTTLAPTPTTTPPTTTATSTTTLAPTTTAVPPTTSPLPTTTTTTTTTAPPITRDPAPDDGMPCGSGFADLEVRAFDISCNTAREVTDAYGRSATRWNYDVVVTVDILTSTWNCQQLRGDWDWDAYQECVNRDRPSERAWLMGTVKPVENRDSGVLPGTGSAGR